MQSRSHTHTHTHTRGKMRVESFRATSKILDLRKKEARTYLLVHQASQHCLIVKQENTTARSFFENKVTRRRSLAMGLHQKRSQRNVREKKTHTKGSVYFSATIPPGGAARTAESQRERNRERAKVEAQ